MSFIGFLKQVGKMAFGYVGGFILFFAGSMTAAQGNTFIGGIVAIFGMILALFGVYSERGL